MGDHQAPMRLRSLFLPGLFTAAAFAVLIGLGTWQIERLHWKQDLVARVSARIAEPPAPLPSPADWNDLDLAAWEYRPVEVAGRFRHELEARVYALLTEPHGPLSGPGYWIVTPFQVEGTPATVLVNRGFVPLENAQKAARPEGNVTVRGLIRAPEARNLFTPDDEPEKRLFYSRDPAAIVPHLGVLDAAPFTIDATETPPGGLPQAGETRLDFPNRHLEYALTWFGLAGALLAVFAAFALTRFRRR
jgi:surfeit locus 1 family protein